jgi:hypothetical protein
MDAFEIQVYDTATAPDGEVGLEAHANYHAIRDAPDEEHLTLEPHYGLAEWAELGGYLQGALANDGHVYFAGGKLRLKLRLRDKLWHGRLGLAINGELSGVPARFEPQVWGSELRPIADVQIGRWYAAVNPIVTTDLAGALAGHPQLEPAAKVAVRASPALALGVEAYAAFGPIDALGSEHAETVLAVLDWTSAHVDVNLGAGPTWGGDDRAIVKVIVGVH